MAELNIDQIDVATERLAQASGVLALLGGNDIFKEVGGADARAAIWAVQSLIEQASAAVAKMAPATA